MPRLPGFSAAILLEGSVSYNPCFGKSRGPPEPTRCQFLFSIFRRQVSRLAQARLSPLARMFLLMTGLAEDFQIL